MSPTRIALAAAIAAGALCASAAQAAVTYQFTIDTSSLAGQDGFIEFQFANAGAFGLQQEATAVVSNFSSVGGAITEANPYAATDLYGNADVFGHVSGLLTDAVTLSDVTLGLDDYFQAFQFGTSFSFQLTLSGPAIDNSLCSGGACSLPEFALDLWNADESQYVLTTDPDGSGITRGLVAEVQVNADGSTTPIAHPATLDGPSAASIAGAAPEPATWGLMLLGFGGVGGLLRRRRQAAFS